VENSGFEPLASCLPGKRSTKHHLLAKPYKH